MLERKHFEEKQIPHKEVQHAPGASAEEYHNALKCRYEQQAKSLLIKVYGPTGEYFAMLAIPAQKRADLDKIKETLNARKVRMANLEELKSVTGCIYGEVPSLGKVFDIRLILDKDFLNEDEIYLNVGKNDISFIMNPKDLVNVEEPILI